MANDGVTPVSLPLRAALQGGEPPGAAVSRLHLVLLLLSALDLRFIFKS